MLQAKDACYVLVRTSTEGFDLYQRLVDAGVPACVAPASHGMQARCGASVLLDLEVVDAARPAIEVAPYPIGASCASRAPSTLRATRIASVWQPCDLRR